MPAIISTGKLIAGMARAYKLPDGKMFMTRYFFVTLVNRAVGGGFSPRRNGSMTNTASRAKAPSHSFASQR